MLYVEPLYIKSTQNSSYPLMKKVLLSYGDFVAYTDTLDEGIASLLAQAKTGPTTGQQPPPTTTNPTNSAISAAVAKINTALNDLQRAQTSGDFAAYGSALKELQAAIDEYNKAKSAVPAPTPTASPGG
jgi:uncharacterized membrane protein (UPF0182 family)